MNQKEQVKKAQSREETAILSSSVNSLHSAVTITDMNRNITYINKAHERTFGYRAQELFGRNSSILFPADDSSGVSNKIYEAISMLGWEGERLALRKDGTAFPVYEKTSVIKDAGGRQLGIVSVIDDISARKKLEHALKESEERYRTLVETATSAIVATDQESRIILFNPAAETVFRHSKDEIMGTDFSELFSEKSRGDYRERIRDDMSSRAVNATQEYTGLRKGGEEFPVEVSFSKCKIDGKPVVTAILFDITERKNLQEQLVQSAKLAAIGELISGVSHEINNPLAIVLGYSEMLISDAGFKGETKQALEAIYSEAERAKKVIQNLLSFARKNTANKEELQVNPIIEKTLTLADYELKKSKVSVTTKLSPGLPEILADPNQLQQVFLNLIINAQQAMCETDRENKLLITTEPAYGTGRAGTDKDKVVLVKFTDNGPGISETNINSIFDPFFTTKPKGKGTGLGLSVSIGIIREHAGLIYVRNNEDHGTTFYIELPVSYAD